MNWPKPKTDAQINAPKIIRDMWVTVELVDALLIGKPTYEERTKLEYISLNLHTAIKIAEELK